MSQTPGSSRHSIPAEKPRGCPSRQCTVNQAAARIIRRAATKSAAVAGVLAQGAIFGIDALFLTPITVQMIAELAKLCGHPRIKVKPSVALGGAAGAAVGAGLARDVCGFFPGVGNLANAAITFAATEVIGWAAYRVLQRGGISPERPARRSNAGHNSGGVGAVAAPEPPRCRQDRRRASASRSLAGSSTPAGRW